MLEVSQLKVKKLNKENWLIVDPDGSSFLSIEHDEGTISRTSGEDWLELFLRPQLSENVPKDIHDLFEVVRGSLPYGYFFYPLFTLASEQLYRIGETAIGLKYIGVGGPPKSVKGKDVSLYDQLIWLRDNNYLSTWDWKDWNIVRKGRNYFSHPKSPDVFPPGAVVAFVNSMVERINKLFSA